MSDQTTVLWVVAGLQLLQLILTGLSKTVFKKKVEMGDSEAVVRDMLTQSAKKLATTVTNEIDLAGVDNIAIAIEGAISALSALKTAGIIKN